MPLRRNNRCYAQTGIATRIVAFMYSSTWSSNTHSLRQGTSMTGGVINWQHRSRLRVRMARGKCIVACKHVWVEPNIVLAGTNIVR
jgi:hypothetical protein